MGRLAGTLSLFILLAITPLMSSLSAQAPAASDVLPGMPRPGDAPASLLAQPSRSPYGCNELPGPYFEQDALLDPPYLPQPGWFADLELGVVGPHFKDRLVDTVLVPGLPLQIVHVPGAELDWTAAPKFEFGYRLESGFGEIALSYRFLVTEGSEAVAGVGAPTALHSRLDMNIVDLDYASSEFSLWPHWDMKWRIGLRYVDVYYDTQSEESLGAAAAGTGIFESGAANNFWGIGPHASIELARPMGWEGFGLVGKVDGATLLGRIHQKFTATSTVIGPDGTLNTGTTDESESQAVPTISAFLGLKCEPPAYPFVHLSAGYFYEYWWNIGRVSSTTSRGELSDQGVLFRAEFTF